MTIFFSCFRNILLLGHCHEYNKQRRIWDKNSPSKLTYCWFDRSSLQRVSEIIRPPSPVQQSREYFRSIYFSELNQFLVKKIVKNQKFYSIRTICFYGTFPCVHNNKPLVGTGRSWCRSPGTNERIFDRLSFFSSLNFSFPFRPAFRRVGGRAELQKTPEGWGRGSHWNWISERGISDAVGDATKRKIDGKSDAWMLPP